MKEHRSKVGKSSAKFGTKVIENLLNSQRSQERASIPHIEYSYIWKLYILIKNTYISETF